MIISLFVVFPLMFWFLFSCLCWIEYFTFPSILSLSLFSRSLPLSLFLCWLLNGPFAASFFFISLFSTQFLAQLIVNKIADDWIRTADLWCRKRSRYQLNHNQCPPSLFIFCSFIIFKAYYSWAVFPFRQLHSLGTTMSPAMQNKIPAKIFFRWRA